MPVLLSGAGKVQHQATDSSGDNSLCQWKRLSDRQID